MKKIIKFRILDSSLGVSLFLDNCNQKTVTHECIQEEWPTQPRYTRTSPDCTECLFKTDDGNWVSCRCEKI